MQVQLNPIISDFLMDKFWLSFFVCKEANVKDNDYKMI
jgi:hypothetical protein